MDRWADAGPRPVASRRDRAAAGVFALAVVVSVPVLFHRARDQWFFLDEWDFLATRDLGRPGTLLPPHNEHWTTLPAVTYRLIFQVVGAHTYWPYLVPVITAHLATAALLRVVMRRAGADAWLATAACTVFVVLGAGREDVLWGFQVTFTGALALGLAALVLSDRGGPLGWVDLVAVAASVGALACSGMGVAMAGAVVLAAALRRDAARAALLAVVPGLAFAVWWFAHRGDIAFHARPPLRVGSEAVGWMLVDALEGLGRTPVVAGLLGAAGVVGLVVAAADLRHRPVPDDVGRRGGRASVVALAAGTGVVLVGTAVSRAGWSPMARGTVPSRYVHVVVALLLPAIVLGLTVAARRVPAPPLGLVLAAALLLVGLPANVRDLEPRGSERFGLGSPRRILAAAAAVDGLGLPRDAEPLPYQAPGLTVGWLEQAIRDGDLPRPDGPVDPALRAATLGEVALVPGTVDPGVRCRPATWPATLARGDVVVVPAASARFVVVVEGAAAAVTRAAGPERPLRVVVEARAPVRVRAVESVPPGAATEVCGAA